MPAVVEVRQRSNQGSRALLTVWIKAGETPKCRVIVEAPADRACLHPVAAVEAEAEAVYPVAAVEADLAAVEAEDPVVGAVVDVAAAEGAGDGL
jgi:hypothetical protein